MTDLEQLSILDEPDPSNLDIDIVKTTVHTFS